MKSAKEILALRKNAEIELKVRGLEEELQTLESGKLETKSITEEQAEKMTDEELETLATESDEIEKTNTEIDEAVDEMKKEIEELKSKIITVEETENKKERSGKMSKFEKRNESENLHEKLNLRNKYKNLELRNKYNNPEKIIKFFDEVRSSVSGQEVLVPTEIIPFLFEELEKTSLFYKYVTVRRTNSDTKVVMAESQGIAIWIEKCDSIEAEIKLGFKGQDFYHHKLAGFSTICNADKEDIASLESMVITNLGGAMAIAWDLSIIVGKGHDFSEPLGIANPMSNIVPTEIKSNHIIELIKKTADVKGTNKVMFMHEKTYNEFILPELLKQSVGIVSFLSGVKERQLGGYTIEFLDEEIIPLQSRVYVGDWKKYIMVERKGVTIEKSTDVNFLQDETVYRAVARYDGRPINAKYFGIFELVPTV